MENQFGERIRKLRQAKKLLQRQIASLLEIDTPMLSKIERGERRAKKEQVCQLAQILKVEEQQLITLWLADQVYDVIKDEDTADDVLRSVSKNIKLKKN